MALLSLELEQLRQIVGPRDLRRHFRNVQDRVLEISTDIHRLSHKLHPSKLDHLGLPTAVKGLCRDFDAAGKIKVKFHQEGDLAKLPKDVKLCMFRIAQEALRNCARHSEAGSACVVLVKSGNELRLSISDDGHGFDMRSGAIRRGLGFTSMRERVRIIGGCIAIRSKPGHGTFIEVSVPLGIRCNSN
jgi:signal transduction histidine kinase